MKYIGIILMFWASNIYAQKQDEAITIQNTLVVYSHADCNSDTIYILQKNEVFLIAEYIEEEIYKDTCELIPVEIPKNKMQKAQNSRDAFTHDSLFIYGFVSKSQIVLIDSLPKYLGNEISLKFILSKADTTEVLDESNLRHGLEVPLKYSYVVTEMILRWGNTQLNQDKIFFDDLFNVSFEEGEYSSVGNPHFAIYKYNDVFFIKQDCGDGAGYYEITWVVKDGKIIQRLIDEI